MEERKERKERASHSEATGPHHNHQIHAEAPCASASVGNLGSLARHCNHEFQQRPQVVKPSLYRRSKIYSVQIHAILRSLEDCDLGTLRWKAQSLAGAERALRTCPPRNYLYRANDSNCQFDYDAANARSSPRCAFPSLHPYEYVRVVRVAPKVVIMYIPYKATVITVVRYVLPPLPLS